LDSLELRLRIDRIDRLADGSALLIDYKTGGQPARSQWELPRPEQPQLLAYALTEEAAAGIGFASVRSGHCKLIDWPKNVSQTARDQTPESEAAWRATRVAWQSELNALARQFVAGQAEVAPKDELKTCRYCDLQVLCRIHEADLPLPDDEADE
jgi:ATP-dependent helicase/nuclease subunit B